MNPTSEQMELKMRRLLRYSPLVALGSLLLLIIGVSGTPPKEIPEKYWDAFTWNGEIPVHYQYHDDSYQPDTQTVYSYEEVEEFKEKALRRETFYYGKTDLDLYEALDTFIGDFQGKTVGILGSTIPWYEAIVLVYGGKPVTIDYNPIISLHPDVRTMTIEEYDENPIQFDYLISISSFEHNGLGRYGDPINPDGDLETMEKSTKMLKPDGYLFLAVPIGTDYLVWNAHRVYGWKRSHFLFKDWCVMRSFGFSHSDFNTLNLGGGHQPIWVLSPKQEGGF